MTRRVGAWTLRWARGMGRQSGLLALNAFALSLLPLLDQVRPGCATEACTAAWDQLLFVPRILYLPLMVAGCILLGSWRAQRRHAKVERAHSTAQDLRADAPETPPGLAPRTMLDLDLSRRTLRGLSLGAAFAAIAMVPFTMTTVALRRCDPWPMASSPLQTCQDTFGWADMIVAYQVWGLLAISALASLLWFVRSISVRRPEGLQEPRILPRRLRRRARWDLA